MITLKPQLRGGGEECTPHFDKEALLMRTPGSPLLGPVTAEGADSAPGQGSLKLWGVAKGKRKKACLANPGGAC